MPNTEEKNPICCSFCGKRESQARLIAGPGVYICSDCVQTCCDLLEDDIYEQEDKCQYIFGEQRGWLINKTCYLEVTNGTKLVYIIVSLI